MIDLNGMTPFAEGDNRLCFIHPDNPRHCLKVMKPHLADQQYTDAPWYKKLRGRKALNDNEREISAYHQRAIVHGGDQIWHHLPRWHGVTPTTLGDASETDFISDDQGNPAPTLEKLLKQQGTDPVVTASLQQLEAWLRETQVLSRNLLPHNIVAKTIGPRYQLYLIDGLGPPTVASILGWSEAWRKHYIERRIQRMWLRANWEAGGREGQWSDIERADR
ncbi:PhoP regulatory network YrbL family protein [Marinobacter sp. BGYM27]|uniref:PhoP regulatory network YrbL family protein n=1 Tax=unclassified Marinobacter TaxID=83889 RepID=UPI0021A70241|nr:PhoP regulatory network YrbL family protein [Marinobacter sp. BGYM27]MDG5501337.1 PhoP regulatory network YrbL family protein [Marinobacter sp. BGYM27]